MEKENKNENENGVSTEDLKLHLANLKRKMEEVNKITERIALIKTQLKNNISASDKKCECNIISDDYPYSRNENGDYECHYCDIILKAGMKFNYKAYFIQHYKEEHNFCPKHNPNGINGTL